MGRQQCAGLIKVIVNEQPIMNPVVVWADQVWFNAYAAFTAVSNASPSAASTAVM
jgi:hypothetical protein